MSDKDRISDNDISDNDFVSWLNRCLAETPEDLTSIAARASISQAYLSLLRTGQRDRPSRRVVVGLANAFGKDANEALRLAGLYVKPQNTKPQKQLAGPQVKAQDNAHYEAPLIDAIQKTLATGQLVLPTRPVWLAQDALRGGSDPSSAGSFALRSPVGVIVLHEQPTFRWHSVDGATSYEVHLLNETSPDEGITPSGEIAQIEWRTPQRLRRGETYEWQVTARAGGRTRTSAPARFTVIKRAQADAVEKAERRYEGLPVPIAIVYASFGLLAEAEDVLRSLPETHLEYGAARKLIPQLAQWDERPPYQGEKGEKPA